MGRKAVVNNVYTGQVFSAVLKIAFNIADPVDPYLAILTGIESTDSMIEPMM